MPPDIWFSSVSENRLFGCAAGPRRPRHPGWSLVLFDLGLLALGEAAQGGDATWEYAVQLGASVQESPPQITLHWPQDTITPPASHMVYRKPTDAASWDAGVALSGDATCYVDTNVAVGTAFEYQIVKTASTHTGYGYIYAGIRAPLVADRGRMAFMVDRTHAADSERFNADPVHASGSHPIHQKWSPSIT